MSEQEGINHCSPLVDAQDSMGNYEERRHFLFRQKVFSEYLCIRCSEEAECIKLVPAFKV